MKFTRIILIIFLFCYTELLAQTTSPEITWQLPLGGTANDEARSMAYTPDGGIIVAGYTASNDLGFKEPYELADYWIIKFDADHTIQWQTIIGGNGTDWARNIINTADGGYLVVGYSESGDGLVGVNQGEFDYWVVKLDANGEVKWKKSFGGSAIDNAYAACQTSDGGFLVVGFSKSNDGNVTGNHGKKDIWLIKISSRGQLKWQRSLGGGKDEEPSSIIATPDGNYLITGYTGSTAGDLIGETNKGGWDYWVLKVNNLGEILSQNTFGGSNEDAARWGIPTSDGGYIVSGYTNSSNGDVTGNHGSADYWLVKLNSSLNLVWQKCYGGSGYDYAYYISKTSQDHYLMTGLSDSWNGDVTNNHGLSDIWTLETNSTGEIIWEKSLGGSGDDVGRTIVKTPEGTYLQTGYTSSDDGDVVINHGLSDAWIVTLSECDPCKLNEESSEITINQLQVSPNPTSGHFQIIVPGNSFNQEAEVTLLTMQGQEMYSTKSTLPTIQCNLPLLSDGIYMIRVKTYEKYYTSMLIVKRN